MSKCKVFPFYFPQFYTIPENDSWWGNGFTDWLLVKNAKAVSSNQRQPRVPYNNCYRDQSTIKTISEQVHIAKKYGIDGFNFYHYWFDGKLILEKPAENILSNKEIDIEYFFTWANETWTRQWIGKPKDILIKQSHIADKLMWAKHYDYLSHHFQDSRYLKVSNKPVFCIYRPELINELDSFIDFFNEKAKASGFDGVHFIALRAYDVLNAEQLYNRFDAIVNFQPRYAINKHLKKNGFIKKNLEKTLRRLPEFVQLSLSSVLKNKGYSEFSYDDYLATLNIKDDLYCLNKPVYQVAFPDWDNSPRYNERATFFSGVDKDKFSKVLTIIKSQVENYDGKIIFVNAWNEWSEGAYLEPDTVNGYQYLEVVKSVFDN